MTDIDQRLPGQDTRNRAQDTRSRAQHDAAIDAGLLILAQDERDGLLLEGMKLSLRQLLDEVRPLTLTPLGGAGGAPHGGAGYALLDDCLRSHDSAAKISARILRALPRPAATMAATMAEASPPVAQVCSLQVLAPPGRARAMPTAPRRHDEGEGEGGVAGGAQPRPSKRPKLLLIAPPLSPPPLSPPRTPLPPPRAPPPFASADAASAVATAPRATPMALARRAGSDASVPPNSRTDGRRRDWTGQRMRCFDGATGAALDGVAEEEEEEGKCAQSRRQVPGCWRVRLRRPLQLQQQQQQQQQPAADSGSGGGGVTLIAAWPVFLSGEQLLAAAAAAREAEALQTQLRAMTAAPTAGPGSAGNSDAESDGGGGGGGSGGSRSLWSTCADDGGGFIGRRVTRAFRSGEGAPVHVTSGLVVAVLPAERGAGAAAAEPALWRVVHTDGDTEDVELPEMRVALRAARALAKGGGGGGGRAPPPPPEELYRRQEAAARAAEARSPGAPLRRATPVSRVGAAFQAELPRAGGAGGAGIASVAAAGQEEAAEDEAQAGAMELMYDAAEAGRDGAADFLRRARDQRARRIGRGFGARTEQLDEVAAACCASDPHPLAGLTVRKRFRGFGWCEGTVWAVADDDGEDDGSDESDDDDGQGGGGGGSGSAQARRAKKRPRKQQPFRVVWHDGTHTPMAESGVRRNLKHKLPPPPARAPLSQGHLGPAAEQDALHALRRAGYDSERALATML